MEIDTRIETKRAVRACVFQDFYLRKDGLFFCHNLYFMTRYFSLVTDLQEIENSYQKLRFQGLKKPCSCETGILT